MTIDAWLSQAVTALKAVGVPTAQLDAEIILAHTIKKPRTYLHAHGDQQLGLRDVEIADARIDLRSDRTPIAYIIGHKEFYGRKFYVTPSTLIPRPESEDALALLSELIPATKSLFNDTPRLVDVGTGSGILAITAKLEHPELDVYGLDISRHALVVAEKNAAYHAADVHFSESDLLENFPFQATYIIANLPYVDETWNDLSPELRHEPSSALFAPDGGLRLIKQLLKQAPHVLTDGGVLLLEADPTQHPAIKAAAAPLGLQPLQSRGYYVALTKRT